jgi:hypothetical protein
MKLAVASAFVLAVSAATAHADTPSPGTALAWSIGGTLAGVGVTAAAVPLDSPEAFVGGEALLAFGPSAGHFYAGETGHGLIVSGLRAGSIVLFDYGLGSSLGCAIDRSENTCGDREAIAALVGLGGVVGLTAYDLIDAPRAARREAARAGGVTIAPMIDRHATGLALVGRF